MGAPRFKSSGVCFIELFKNHHFLSCCVKNYSLSKNDFCPHPMVCLVCAPIFAARRRVENRPFKKVGAPREFFAPAFMECCIKIASPRAAAPRDIPATALDKKVLHFNHLSFPIVQFKGSFFMDFF